VIRGETVEEIAALLDDHIVKTQTMKSSQFAKVFEARCKDWEDKLLYIRNCMDYWLKVQSLWLYLEPIFFSEDIMHNLPNEGNDFKKVN
jgi:dynein heavy chain, axonemal